MIKTPSTNLAWVSDFFYWLLDTLSWAFLSIWHFLGSVAIYALTYFIDIKSEVHVMFFAFAFDLGLGIIKSILVNGEKFQMKKAFIGFMRLLISLITISLLYSMDRELHQESVSLFRIFTYIVTGAWIISFTDNGYQLTKWRPFLKVKGILSKGIELKGKKEKEEGGE